MILKSNKIRDQGMEIDIFVLRFKICICGVGENIMMGFLGFSILGLFVTSFKYLFEKRLKIIFGISIFKASCILCKVKFIYLTCLQKERKNKIRDIRALRLEIKQRRAKIKVSKSR